LALGREGPTVQMGGAVGAGISQWLKASAQERLTLISAGAGAGLAAAFNAPLAGLVFVLEELQRDFRPAVFGAAFLAAATADVVSRFFSGQLPAFAAPAYPTPSLSLLPAFAVLGVACGLLGVLFNKGVLGSLNVFGRVPPHRKVTAGFAVGALVGLTAYFVPTYVGGGHGIAEAALHADLPLAILPPLFLLRFVLTLGSYGTGAPGGIFAPLLALGALIGLGLGQIAAIWFPSAGVLPGAFAVVGMASYFTAIVRAPLTGIVLIVEMTSSYALSLPLLVACFCAYGVAEGLGNLPIYESLLQRDLASGKGVQTTHEEPIVLELEVERDAPFAGRKVRELGLPSGVLLIECRDGHREWVPDAETVLLPHTRVTAVVSHASPDGLKAFRSGCSAHSSLTINPEDGGL
ncbi:ClC family H(+)/Cl(-) exchange transporter, partial [bacterium]